MFQPRPQPILGLGLPPTGTQNLGGPAVTAGGLLLLVLQEMSASGPSIREREKFFGNTNFLQAATPSVYEVEGKQYVVIAAGGGGKLGIPSSDAYIAFSLKK